jgi:uncharacterized membrane protein YiaA
MGTVSVVVGALAIVVGLVVYLVVRNELTAQRITVSEDAPFLAGSQVAGPFTAYAEALALADHAEEIGGGKTYAEIPSDDPARNTVMTADFLQASLYTSVVAFGVCALIAALGVMFIFVGLTFRALDQRTASLVGGRDDGDDDPAGPTPARA